MSFVDEEQGVPDLVQKVYSAWIAQARAQRARAFLQIECYMHRERDIYTYTYIYIHLLISFLKNI